MKKYFKILLIPLLATVLNALLTPLYILLPRPGGDIVFNVIRVSLWIFAGWRLTSIGGFGIWVSALSGAILLFIDHTIYKGGRFLIRHEFLAFEGVIASYCMFCWVPVVFSAIGAAIGKLQNSEPTTGHAESGTGRQE